MNIGPELLTVPEPSIVRVPDEVPTSLTLKSPLELFTTPLSFTVMKPAALLLLPTDNQPATLLSVPLPSTITFATEFAP